MQFIGIDFGTSNSLGSLVRNGNIEFVRFSDDNFSNPTLIYFPQKSKQIDIGTAAIEKYLIDLEEHEAVGRLMLSIKTLLPEANFDQTLVYGHGPHTAADLAGKFLAEVKKLAETQFKTRFDGVVLGHPVDFSDLAIRRLEIAANLAGFKEVIFRLEPVAAAMAYERQVVEDELVCVVDIGGGTSDICVVEVSPRRSDEANRAKDVKATGGIYLAGDELNSQIMKQRLARRFGEDSSYTSLGKTLPFPVHIINTLTSWHRIHQLNEPKTLNGIASMLVSSDRPEDVERLLNLMQHHYGFELFRAIDHAKKHLSNADLATVKFSPLSLREEITIKEFELWATPLVTELETAVLDCLKSASVKSENIKRVILTGGSSQVPILDRTIRTIFGEEKIIRPDFFASIATGLGLVASKLN